MPRPDNNRPVVELPNPPEELAPYRPQLTELARPCLTLRPLRADGPLPAGTSKVGGHPDLPAGNETGGWPVNDDGVPVPFAFQVHLPGQGLVQFFTTFVADATWTDGNQWRDDWFEPACGDNRILVHASLDGLSPAPGGPEPFQEEWRLVAEPAVSLPEYLELPERSPELFAALRADKRLREAYRNWLTYDLGVPNQAGGYPHWLQDPAYSEAAARDRGLRFADLSGSSRVELEAAGRDWQLVCELDSLIGDDGRMYLLAPDGDLGRTQYVYQCT
jgi:hypothetical protein